MDGNRLIKVIVDRLDTKDIRCHDYNIVSELRQMTQYELEQLIKK